MTTLIWQESFRLHFLALLACLSAAGCAASVDGDGTPICGNGVLEVGEACDDGNAANDDGCSSSCLPEGATDCGNGSLDSGEACDDGNTTAGDGCSASCLVEQVCGNGNVEGTEECDDGNIADGDGCDAQCDAEDRCGNDLREGEEECDDGNVADGDGCSATCTLEPGICGDGVFNSGEQCDDGNKTPGDGCDEVCNLEGSVCSNGNVESGETCDDGNLTNFDGCSNTCQTEECGDSVLQPGETCDDGNVISNDGCSSTCLAEGAISCGNNILEAGEECDDGNVISNDGCSATCTDESTGLCVDEFSLSCGSTDTWNTTFLGSTDEIESYSCASNVNESGREYTYRYVAASTGSVTLNLTGMTSDLDLFVIADDGDCSQDSCIGFGNTTTQFSAIAGRTYFIVVDGFLGAEGPYSISLDCGVCGDGEIDADETCDDGNAIAGDGCDALCQTEGVCETGFDVSCGFSENWSTLNIGSTDEIDSYSCSAFNESGREYAYRFTPAVNTIMNIALTPEAGVDLDLFVLSDDGNQLCESGDCDIYADSSVEATFPGGGEYWIVVDGYNGAEGSYSIDFACKDCAPGMGNNGDSCADVYQGSDIWRCTTSPNLGDAIVSQVCRDNGSGPVWVTFHVDPIDCCECDGEFDTGCCTVDSGSAGCP